MIVMTCPSGWPVLSGQAQTPAHAALAWSTRITTFASSPTNPKSRDLAVGNGEVFDDAHRPEPLDLHVVEEHRLVAAAHLRQQLDVRHEVAEVAKCLDE